MNTRQVLFFSLLVMTLQLSPTFGGLLPTVKDWVEDTVDSVLSKHSSASADTTVVANPSSPPAVTESKTLLYGTTVDVDIKKVPLVTVSDAPCKNICKNVCKLDFTQSCKKVPVKSKECTPTTKTLTKKICSKKCSLTVETPKIIKSITPAQPQSPPSPTTDVTPEVPATPPSPPETVPNPSNPPTSYPNPSNPPAYNPNPSNPPEYYPNPSAPTSYPNPSAPEYHPNPSAPEYHPNPSAPTAHANPSEQPIGTVVDTVVAEAQLPSLDDVPEDAIVDADLDSSSSSNGRRLSGLLAAKLAVATGSKIIGSLPVPDCDEVCQDVHFEVPEIECKVVHYEVESCKSVPTKNCEQKCVCLPQKDIDINLPKKAIDVSFSKKGVESHIAAAYVDVSVDASASVDVAIGGDDENVQPNKW